MSFAVEDADESRMYASLYALSQLWTMDYEVNCTRYGCVFVKGKDDDLLTGAHQAKSKSDGASRSAKCLLYLSLANPEPVWISKKKDGVIFPEEKFIKTGVDSVAGAVYFGRSSVRGGTPSRVNSIGGRCDMWYTASGDQEQSGELLRDTGHEFIRAKSGDPLPPHAVIVGMSDTHGSLYLGRVGGNIPCSISTNDDGRIKSFCYFSWPKEKRVERGEIMLLTGRN
ncbi:hypothetical protein OS493_035412 [Desmophyllum pertusum]|uniref:Uncharacterized protein n=1 Tax=Desmophyllum pertusum TaxID=174260 RepID=A0A9W9ZIH0_9CNID|nr:hypothetical protein OS493_035412 [Desmophyllum pertusum]